MARIEKTVFISYRRTNVPWALAIYQNLTMHGYDVFFDYNSIDSGNFEKIILENIKARAHFLVVLTPSALERLKEPGDWLRREIETAMDEKRNIVPLMLESFDFGSPLVTQALTGKLADLNKFNGLRVYSEYFFEAMDKLRERYLNVAVSDISLPAITNAKTQAITKSLKLAASEAAPVEKEQLTAQEWAERAYVFLDAGNFDEAIRCYSEAIPLDPNDVYSLGIRGLVYALKGDYETAIADLGEAIRVKPDFVVAYTSLGLARKKKGDLEGAITDYNEAIRLKPDEIGYSNLGALLKDLKRYNESETAFRKAIEINPSYANGYLAIASINKQTGKSVSKDYTEKARQFMPEDDWYNRACLESVCDHFDLAFENLRHAAQHDRFNPTWAWDNPDLQWIRDDPRFIEIVGPRPE